MNRKCLVIPGIGGSQLRANPLFAFSPVEVWLDYFRLAALGWESMALAVNGVDPPSVLAPSLEGGPHVSWYYPVLCDHLRARGWDPQSGFTDWRKSLAISSTVVANQIDALSADGPVTVIGHSRGGLVALVAVQLLAARGRLGAVRQIVSVATPFGGSYEPMGYLGGWADSVGWLSIALFSARALITSLAGLTRVRRVVTTWPGLYELLPSPTLAAAAGELHVADIYSAAEWAADGVPVSEAHLTAARIRWASPLTIPPGLKWSAIVGRGYDTPGPVNPGPRFDRPSCLGRRNDGDGIVPLWSATATSALIYYTGVPHNAMITDGAGLAVLDALIDS